MFGLELIVFVVSLTEPLIIGALMFISLGRIMSSESVSSLVASVRSSSSPYKFYECASYTRLTSLVALNTPFLVIMLAYVIYDVDVVLLISEVSLCASFGLRELIVLALYFYFFIVGLYLDFCLCGYSWSVR